MSFQGNCTNIFIMQENIWKYFSTNLLKRRNFPLSSSSVVWCCAVERYCCWVVSTAQHLAPAGTFRICMSYGGPHYTALDTGHTQLSRVPQFSHFTSYLQYSFYLLAECTTRDFTIEEFMKTTHQPPTTFKGKCSNCKWRQLVEMPIYEKECSKGS